MGKKACVKIPAQGFYELDEKIRLDDEDAFEMARLPSRQEGE